MSVLRTVIMLIHPLLAVVLVTWLVRQYGWRKRGMTLRGEEREASLKRHQKHGEYILWAGITLALIAFVARAISGYIVEGDATSDLLPQSVHGYTGPIGLILLWLVVRYGKETATNKENGEKFSTQRTKAWQSCGFGHGLNHVSFIPWIHLHIPSHLSSLDTKRSLTILPHFNPIIQI
jgi:ABC-type Fe3+ transport system permease subunit